MVVKSRSAARSCSRRLVATQRAVKQGPDMIRSTTAVSVDLLGVILFGNIENFKNLGSIRTCGLYLRTKWCSIFPGGLLDSAMLCRVRTRVTPDAATARLLYSVNRSKCRGHGITIMGHNQCSGEGRARVGSWTCCAPARTRCLMPHNGVNLRKRTEKTPHTYGVVA